MAKLPAFQFYPGDWLRDPVAGCSLSAQGLWLRMMFLMHDSDRYGYLSMNGVPIPSEQIAKRTACDSLEQYTTLLNELFAASVPSRTSGGVIYCRRMVEDAKKRAETAGRVAKFRSKSRNDNENSNADVTHDVTHLKHRSSSSVSSSSSASTNKDMADVSRWLMGEIFKAYKRPESDVLNYAEQTYLLEVAKRQNVRDEWATLLEFKAIDSYFPGSIESLLEKWTKTLDRARNYKPPASPQPKSPSFISSEVAALRKELEKI